jgi:hypothetical protein
LFPGEDSEVESSNFSVLSSDEEDDAGRYADVEPNDEDLEQAVGSTSMNRRN